MALGQDRKDPDTDPTTDMTKGHDTDRITAEAPDLEDRITALTTDTDRKRITAKDSADRKTADTTSPTDRAREAERATSEDMAHLIWRAPLNP